MSESLFELSSISKTFTSAELSSTVINQLSLTVEDGEFVSVIGPSGSGKSTLLSIIGLLDTPTSGEHRLSDALVSGLSFKQLAEIRNRHIGWIFQNFSLIGSLNVHDNVSLPLRYRRPKSAYDPKIVEEALEQVGLLDKQHMFPAQLSGGQQQRAAIARAIVGKPSLIVADEPTGNLDSENGQRVLAILKSLNHDHKTTIILVTHDIQHALHADRVISMVDGEIISDRKSAELSASKLLSEMSS